MLSLWFVPWNCSESKVKGEPSWVAWQDLIYCWWCCNFSDFFLFNLFCFEGWKKFLKIWITLPGTKNIIGLIFDRLWCIYFYNFALQSTVIFLSFNTLRLIYTCVLCKFLFPTLARSCARELMLSFHATQSPFIVLFFFSVFFGSSERNFKMLFRK